MSDVVVIGGGVIGVFIAYELALRGAKVTLLERETVGSAASYGNAGLIVPSYGIPMANPASIRMGLKALVNKEDAIKIGLRVDTMFWAWLVRFMVASCGKQVNTSTAILCDLGNASKDLYDQFFDAHPNENVGFERRGWLYVYRSAKGLEEGVAQARTVGQFGIPWQQVLGPELLELEPALAANLAGGVFYTDDSSLDPYLLVRFVARLAQESGVRIEIGVTVKALKIRNGRVHAAVTNESEFQAETFVVAAGVSSPGLLRTVLPAMPVQPAKGYSLTFPRTPGNPKIPLSLAESHVVVSPRAQQVRLTGGLDLVGLDTSMNTHRLEGIWRAARSYLPGLDQPATPERWCGFRPMSPDGLPIIGPLENAENMVVATGHGTLGITLAPITGRLVADLITTKSLPIHMNPMLPGRFRFRRTIEKLGRSHATS
ncbi:MAG: D-amino acid dehydrogenase [Chloroflexota bacterium]